MIETASSHDLEGPKTFAATIDEATPSSVDEVDAFVLSINKGKKKKRKSKRKAVQISISSAPTKKDATISEGLVAPTVTPSFEQSDLIPDGDIDGDLSFFSETHEENGKGPESAETHSSDIKNRLPAELEKLEKDKAEDMAKINAYLIAKWEERTEILNKQVSKIRQDMLIKQKTQRAQLAEKHKTQQELDKRKIEEGRKWLLERQQQQLRQEAEQTGKAGNAIMEEWSNISAQLQTRHAYQLKQFEVKEATMKERSANDANAQNQILEAHHKKRSAEAEAFVEELIKKCQQRQKNLKANLTRLHEQRFEEKKREIQIEFAKPIEPPVSERELKSVDPQSYPQELGNDLDSSSAHTAVLRHKRRKHIMNGTTVQVAVDIHNEGLFLMARSTHENESLSRFGNVSNTAPGIGTIVTDDISGRPCLFIPWGSKARSFLYSIVCGEIPPGYGLEKVSAGSTSNQKLLDGGLVKCMVTDTRTSRETAMNDRAQSYPEIQKMSNTTRIENATKLVASYKTRIEELESDITTLSLREQKIAQAHRDATQHLERSKATMDKLKLHLQQFFGKDGAPSPNLLNPEGQQKILSTMYKYKTAYESKRNEESALREPLELARKVLISKKEELEKVKQEIQKLDAFKKEVNSKSGIEVNMIDKRAENLINSICQVAQRRRAQVNLKKSNSDPVHDISEEEKKSFAQKMTRRRIVTMLRPTQVSILNEVKEMVGKSDANIDPKLRAEELLLLSLYPQAEEALAPVPTSTSLNWPEPGWQLNLSPPEEDNPHSILPLDQVSHMPRQNLSVCCSSGRQTAALVQQRHLSMLEGPLSFVSKASAPAETNPGSHKKIDGPMTSDPLSITEDDMRLGYSFVVRPPKNTGSKTKEVEQKTQTKRKSTNVVDDSPKKEAKARRKSQTQAGETSPKSSQSVVSSAPRQQPAPVATTTPTLMQQNQPMQQPNQPLQPSNQPMQLQNPMLQSNPPMQLQNPMQQSNQQQNIMQQQNPNISMQHQHRNMPMQQNQSVALPNNNVVNRQSFMNMSHSPEQYQWMLQQQQIRLQQQQQQIQLQQFQNQQQMQQHRQQPQNQGQSNNASHPHQQQNTRR